MPIGYGPFYLRAVFAYFVRLLVAAMVLGLAGAGDHQHRGLRNPGVGAPCDSFIFAVKLPYGLPDVGPRHHDERLPLGEARAGSVPRQLKHSLNDLRWHRLI